METSPIIKRIETRLIEIGMSKMELYEKSGVSSASYSQWNTGLYNPSKRSLKKIAECLQVSPEYLLTGEAPNKEAPSATQDTTSISAEDYQHILAYHAASPAIKEAIDKLLEEYKNKE